MIDETDPDNYFVVKGLHRLRLAAANLADAANHLESLGARVKIAAEVEVTPPPQPLKPPTTGLQDALEQAEAEAKVQTPAEPVADAVEAHGRFEVRVAGGAES